MMNRFNLIDEHWIPVTDIGLVNLKQIFRDPTIQALGGNPVQKIAITKLLQAIAQAACTPEGNKEWHELGWDGLAKCCLSYLEQWHDRFYLYSDRPFLQIPAIDKAKVQTYGAVIPEVSTGNTTILTQSQSEQPLNDADKALLLVTLMGFALGGKKTDNSIVLARGYMGKCNAKGNPSTGKPGPSVAYLGLLHTFCLGETLQQTIWLNLFTLNDVISCGFYPEGVGVAPWEKMPKTEACETACQLTKTLQGRLVSLSRFCLLNEEGLHYSEGLAHPNYKEGVIDPTVAVNFAGTVPKAIWVNPEKRPWRELTALLGFIQHEQTGADCPQLQVAIARVRDYNKPFALWSGGLKVRSNAGEQYASGTDDSVESTIWLEPSILGGSWFQCLKVEVAVLESLAKSLYGCVVGYYKQLLADGTSLAAQSSNMYWQLCERDFQQLVNSCDDGGAPQDAKQDRFRLRHQFAGFAQNLYDRFCPQETARQMDAWAKCRPNFSKHLKNNN